MLWQPRATTSTGSPQAPEGGQRSAGECGRAVRACTRRTTSGSVGQREGRGLHEQRPAPGRHRHPRADSGRRRVRGRFGHATSHVPPFTLDHPPRGEWAPQVKRTSQRWIRVPSVTMFSRGMRRGWRGTHGGGHQGSARAAAPSHCDAGTLPTSQTRTRNTTHKKSWRPPLTPHPPTTPRRRHRGRGQKKCLS